MKKIIILVSIIFSLNSCSDWLDVTPRSEIREDVLFETENGYKSALTGVYIQIAKPDLYGKNTTMYMPEALSRHWTLPTDNTTQLYRLGNFDYSHSTTEALISNIWLKYYNAIVQLNNILSNLNNSNIAFNYNNDRLIKGEVIGLRAFLHLDILRYFGPIPQDATLADIAIPYVTVMTKDPNKLVSLPYSDVLNFIEQDLNDAERLLEIDPIITNPNKHLNSNSTETASTPKDSWQRFRQGRFNYYAVLGAKARFYHWIGDKEKAVIYAKKVIEALNTDNSRKFTLTDESTFSGADKNLVMYSEHLFGIENPDLQSVVAALFKNEDASLTQSPTYLNTAYEKTANPDDIRYIENRYWEYKTYDVRKTNHFRKYTGNDLIKTNNRVPLLRLSEMYLIIIEDLPLSEVKSYFSTYRLSRSLLSSIEDSSLASESALNSRLEKEYRKEFYGEGQMFFFYKMHKYTAYTWPAKVTINPEVYVIPKPKGQLSFE